MARTPKRNARAAQRGYEAVSKIAGLGLVFLLLPAFLGNSPLSAAFRPLASIGWLLLAGASVMGGLLYLSSAASQRKKPVPPEFFPPTGKELRRPSKPAPLVTRIEPKGEFPVFTQPDFRARLPEVQPPPAERPRPTAWEPGVFSVIEWRRFEAVIEALFAQAGFVTKAQSHGPDEGVDVWLYSKNQPDGAPVSVVQCKHWQGAKVGVDKVRELRGVMAAKNVSRGQFATTSTFTSDAIAFGTANGIKLHDMAGLLDLIGKRTEEQQRALLEVALEGDYWRPTCVNCGVKMIDKTRRQGGQPFWGCVNYPKCRTTMQMRAA